MWIGYIVALYVLYFCLYSLLREGMLGVKDEGGYSSEFIVCGSYSIACQSLLYCFWNVICPRSYDSVDDCKAETAVFRL